MATITRLPSGNWRAQIRRQGRHTSRTFRFRAEADSWAQAYESDHGVTEKVERDVTDCTFEGLIDLYFQDMQEAGYAVGRTRLHFLERIRPTLGQLKLSELTRPKLIEFGRTRAKEGAGPSTLNYNFSDIQSILTHTEAVHGVKILHEEFRLARVALRRLGFMSRSVARTRRPTVEEIDRLIHYFENHPRQHIPVDRIIKFAIATAMRAGEIFRLEWNDVDMKKRLITIRDRKGPRDRRGNDDVIPLLNVTGFDAWQLLFEQRILTRNKRRVFPYNSQAVGLAFRRGCVARNIENLHFHDLRREAATRLFEAGLPIERVALITGHKSWDMLRRYTRLKPEDLVKFQTSPQPSVAEFIENLMTT